MAGLPALAMLPEPIRLELAGRLTEADYAPGEAVVREGEVGDRLYLIVQGRAEVTTVGRTGPIPLATLEAGELFGEIALLTAGGQRRATVTALTPLLTLTLEAGDFVDLIRQHPAVKETFTAWARVLEIAKFLKVASPFARLSGEQARELAARVTEQSVPGGAVVVRQGDRGEACYLLRAGQVEVSVQEDGRPERRLATLGPGMLFGEAALLTEAPRNATVRALEACDLLVLERADLLAVMGQDQGLEAHLLEMLRLRERPNRQTGILLQERLTAEGDTITTLKDPQRGAYYRLSPQGRFLWELLDGHHTLRDLTMAYWQEFKAFAPQAVAGVVGGLAAAGFVETNALRTDVATSTGRLSGWPRALAWTRRWLEWRLEWQNVDAVLTRIYHRGFHRLYTPLGQLLLGLVALAGLTAFLGDLGRAQAAIFGPGGHPALLGALIPAAFLAVVLHEAGHALTTKAFGREVRGLGLGWYWFGPIAYVDTSDVWLASRWPRLAVSLAGPYANLVTGGLAALFGWLTTNPVSFAILWQFACLSYISALAALNPLLEYDGYYVLMDLMERPNLRRQCLGWLGREFPRSLVTPGGLKGHYFEMVYGIGSLLYVVLMAGLTLILYRLLLQDWLARLLPGAVAASLAWVVALLVAMLCLVGVAGELREQGSGDRG